jgi:hypothetical protein
MQGPYQGEGRGENREEKGRELKEGRRGRGAVKRGGEERRVGGEREEAGRGWATLI